MTTHENRSEARRQACQRWLRAIAKDLTEPVCVFSPDTTLTFVNDAGCQLLGRRREDLVGAPLLPHIDEPDRTAFERHVSSLTEASPVATMECRLRHADGREIPQRFTSRAVLGRDGRVVEIQAVGSVVAEDAEASRRSDDLEALVETRTRRVRELEQRRMAVEKLAALGNIAAGIAHEINNPLAGIKNSFILVKRAVPPDHENYEFVELIEKEIDRIKDIVGQMHQLYYPSQRRPLEFDVGRTVREVWRMLDGQARAVQVEVETLAPDEGPLARLPEGEVRQVLYNVFQNAIHASPPGTTITVTVGATDGEVCVAVADRGPGVPPDVLPRVFEPFFTTKEKGSLGGMGLGLSVSHSLVDAMGGRIDIQTAPGKGATFSIVLPAEGGGQGSDR